MMRIHPSAALVTGVLAVSTGAVFVRLADAPPLVIAAYRMGIAALILLAPACIKSKDEIAKLTGREIRLSIVSGFFLALHFAAWITSLSYTSIANSVVLVNTNPLWVAVFTPLVTGEKIRRGVAAGIALSIAGVVMIAAKDLAGSHGAWGGDLLALAGGICAAMYLLLGRTLRRRLSLMAYVAVCYTSAAVFLWLFVLIFSQPFTGFDAGTWLFMGALALVSQLIGHTAYNWALKWFSPALIAVSLLGEPIVGTLLAYVIFGERVAGLQFFGGGFILAAIYISAAGEKKRSEV